MWKLPELSLIVLSKCRTDGIEDNPTELTFNLQGICHMKPEEESDKFEKQALTEHLRELRSCLIVSLVAVSIGFGLAYAVIQPIGTWFFKPLSSVLPKGTSLIFTSYQEGFFFT
jgi:sec-independent protein translocase protein TatC